jgi:ankyrin repeat protein/flagellar biosynthesis protein FliQ
MKVDCLKCYQRIQLGETYCPYCGTNLLADEQEGFASPQTGNTTFIKTLHAFLWVVEIILVVFFGLGFAMGTPQLFYFISSKLTEAVLWQALFGVAYTLATGIVVLTLGLYLAFSSEKQPLILERVRCFLLQLSGFLEQLLSLFKFKKQRKEFSKTTIKVTSIKGIGFYNQCTNYLCDRFPYTLLSVLPYLLINAVIVATFVIIFSSETLIREGVGLGFIAIILFVFAHFILYVGVISALILDVTALAKKQRANRLQAVGSNFNIQFLMLQLCAIPTIAIYGFITKSFWEPTVFGVVASSQQKLQRELEQESTVNIGNYLDKGANVNTVDAMGKTPLMLASEKGDLKLVHQIMSDSPDINRVSRQGYSALMYALATDQETVNRVEKKAIAELLLSRGSRPDIIAEDCYTPLKLAALSGETSLVQQLLNAGAKINIPEDQKSQYCSAGSPLMEAAKGGNNPIIKILLAKGADINAAKLVPQMSSSQGYTALMYAVEAKKPQTASYLIERGANVNVSVFQGITPLILAAQKGDIELVKVLLKAGANPSQESIQHETPLSEAACVGNMDLINRLIAAGAKIDPKGLSGKKALWAAIFGENPEIVKLFIQHGVDVNSQTPRNYSMLMEAVERNNVQIASILLNAGAKPDNPIDEGHSTLAKASSKGNAEIVSLLLAYGANVNAKTNKNIALTLSSEFGATPLILSAINGASSDVILMLLRAGAETNILNQKGETALDCAKAHFKQYKDAQSGETMRLLKPYYTTP